MFARFVVVTLVLLVAVACPRRTAESSARVPMARLQSLLPQTVLAMQRTNLRGQEAATEGPDSFSQASSDYGTGPAATLWLELQDNPSTARSLLARKPTGSSFKSHPIVDETEKNGVAELRFIVDKRFIVHGYGERLTVTQLKTAFESIDLAQLGGSVANPR